MLSYLLLLQKEDSGYVPSPNQYNEDTPATKEQFVIEYNSSVIDYKQKVEVGQSHVLLISLD